MCLLTKLHCNCCHKFCVDYMLDLCARAKECNKVECYNTNGSFCNLCEEHCRRNEEPCILNKFRSYTRIEPKNKKQKELSKVDRSFTNIIF